MEKKTPHQKYSVYKCLIAIIVVIFDVIIIATIIYFHSLSFCQTHGNGYYYYLNFMVIM